MMRRVLAIALLVASACDKLPELPLPKAQDGGIVHVPGAYTIARLTPGHKAHLALTGDKKVECHDCHAIADAGFESPPVALCQNCHKDQSGHHHPFPDAGVGDAGTPMGCLTCHVFLSKTPQATFERWACMTCHATQQHDKKPITIHLGNCPQCHHPHDDPFTKPADCSTCHLDITLTHGEKGASLAERCLDCHPPHTPASAASARCLSCHMNSTMEAKARVAEGALFSPGHVSCGSCHVAHTFLKNQVKACTSCHAKQQVLAPAAHKLCTSCHEQHADHAAPKACTNCHEKIVASIKHPSVKKGAPEADGGVTFVKSDGPQTCTGCHPPHAALGTAKAVACLTCHTTPTFTAALVHGKDLTCGSCHALHAGKPKAEALCVTCHKTQVNLVKKNTGHQKCENCHAGLPHGGPVTPKACLTCHEKKTPPQAGHKECASCHESHSAKVIKTCAECHLTPTSPKLPGLHAVAKHNECKSCHGPHEPQPGFGPASCLACHKKPLSPTEHPTPPTQCVGCHLFKAAK